MSEPIYSTTIAGWREWVGLPGIDVPWIKAKLDTGARSSALHAFDVEEFVRTSETDGAAVDWVRFRVRPWQRSVNDVAVVERPVHDRRVVRSSSGHSEERIVVLLDIQLFGRTITAETTLSNRDQMGFRMLIGREALSQGFLVDAGKSFLAGRAPKEVRRRNRAPRAS
ncbi:ATP-dependent zinc protease [Leifsonia sp. YAF41]|uniref:ATP-dependent zinc protease family protein n=1 Tax=Leifsonia sp. YAF41 TaxID=3233086 RepID=UPI003F97BA70